MSARALRIGIFVAVGGATLVLALSFVPPILVWNDPTANGLQWVIAMMATPIYLVLVLPALVLGLIGRPLPLKFGAGLLLLAYAIALLLFFA